MLLFVLVAPDRIDDGGCLSRPGFEWKTDWETWSFVTTIGEFELRRKSWSNTAVNRNSFNCAIGNFGIRRDVAFSRHEIVWRAMVPTWMLIAAFGAYPAICSWRIAIARRRMRRNPNGCTTCGYDLTGNVSGVCPECGTAIPENRVMPTKPTAL